MRKLLSEQGETLYKEVRVKIFQPGNKDHFVKKYRAKPGQGLSGSAVDTLIEKIAADIESKIPTNEYSLVQTGPASYNFVWRGVPQVVSRLDQTQIN